MEGKLKRTTEEMRKLVEDYKQSGMTRRQYCEQHKIAVTALAYHYTQARKRSLVPVLVKVLVKALMTEPNGFTLVLGNGRRIEIIASSVSKKWWKWKKTRGMSLRGCACFKSSPFTSIASSSGLIVMLAFPVARGQWKQPRSRRLAQTHSPLPSHTRPQPEHWLTHLGYTNQSRQFGFAKAPTSSVDFDMMIAPLSYNSFVRKK